jgi:hypothetical protein
MRTVTAVLRSRGLLSAVVLSCTLLGANFAQAQDTPGTSETATGARGSDAMRGSEQSGIEREQNHDADSDGDGLADAALQGNQAGDPIPGIDITRTSEDQQGSGTQRKKMKKLKPTESEPLELMDETDTCPTLPCPTP